MSAKLHSATFKFSQDANCRSETPDDYEFLEVEFISDLGLDNDMEFHKDKSKVGFFILKTEQWAFEDENEVKELFERIKKIL